MTPRSRAPGQSAEARLYAHYVRVWALMTAVRVWSRRGTELRGNAVVGCTSLAAMMWPRRPWLVALAFAARVVAMLSGLPYLCDVQTWCLHTDVAVLASLLVVMTTRARRRREEEQEQAEEYAAGSVSAGASLSADEAARVIAPAAGVIRFQLIVFYAAAAFWKLNEGFLHARFSCAPVFVASLIERFVPAGALPLSWRTAAVAAAPALVLLVEWAIAILLLVRVRAGVILAAAFHLLIALTPPPNAVPTFGCLMLPRMLLLLDPEPVAGALEAAAQPGLAALAVALVAALTAAAQRSQDVHLPLCGAMVALAFAAAIRQPRGRCRVSVHPSFRKLAAAMRVWAGVYAFVALPLGLADFGTPNMFSSLRVYGGGNHLLAPTGLLQAFLHDAPPGTVLGDAFGGGIIRIVNSNATHLCEYPGDITSENDSGTLSLLRASGHLGLQFSPAQYAYSVGNHFDAHRNDLKCDGAVAYTLPAAELRHILSDARRRFPHETFEFTGALLDGPAGDERWRATSAGTPFVLHRGFEGDEEHMTCTDPASGRACSPRVRAVLLSQPSGHSMLARALRSLLLSQPYPIIEQAAGAHRRVVCFGP